MKKILITGADGYIARNIIKKFSNYDLTVVNRTKLNLLDEKLGGLVSIVWSKMMCTETDRAQGREMIILGLYRLKILVEDTLLLLQSYKYEHENSIVCTFDELD
jgi:hypothetical protein